MKLRQSNLSTALGNTPAVARASYVDRRVVKAYQQGETIATALKRARRCGGEAERQAILEKATRTMIRRVSRD